MSSTYLIEGQPDLPQGVLVPEFLRKPYMATYDFAGVGGPDPVPPSGSIHDGTCKYTRISGISAHM